jgi:DNA-binding GntR family transcriptional regulator
MIEHMQESSEDRSVAADIARVLARRIVSGVLAPGARLRQDHIAAEFRASHVPVREAFQRLDALGLVVTEPRRGVRVAPMEAADVLEVSEMRAALEVLALRHAAPGLTPEDFVAAREVAGASEDLEAANQAFHRILTRGCGMPRLLASIEGLHHAAARHLHAAWQALDWQARSDAEHEAILAALETGDVEAAERLLAAHIRAAGRALAVRLGRKE